MWPERDRQIFEAGSREPAAPRSQPSPGGSPAGSSHGEIKGAVCHRDLSLTADGFISERGLI